MKAFSVLSALLLASCSAPPPPAQPRALDPVLRGKIDRGVQQLVKNPKNSCVAIGLLRDGVPQVLGYGPASEADPTPPDGNTVFEIGSITKTFTALLLWQAVQDGTLALEDPIIRHLPKGIDAPSRHDKEITLVQLASHTSGLPIVPANFRPRQPLNPWADYTVDDLFQSLELVTLESDPGEKYDYSNLGVGLLGQILARRAGTSYEALVADRICKPLGLNDTGIRLSEDQRRRLAPGHNADGKPTPNWDFPGLAGAGALRSTVNDMLRYLEAHFADAYAPTRAPRISINGTLSVGLAWHLLSVGPMTPKIVWHNGATGGYRSFAGYVPETRTAVVVLTNSMAEVDRLGVTLLKLLQDVQ